MTRRAEFAEADGIQIPPVFDLSLRRSVARSHSSILRILSRGANFSSPVGEEGETDANCQILCRHGRSQNGHIH
jgi:hypothetical protein